MLGHTSVTTSQYYWRWKGIHYRMHPDNVQCLAVADLAECGELLKNFFRARRG